MQVIEVNGKNLIVGSNNDIIDIIRERCGDELADLVSKKLSRGDSDEVYAKEAVNTDLASYESQLDSNNSCFYDVLDIVDELLEMTNGRINKAKLIDKLDEIKSIINCQV